MPFSNREIVRAITDSQFRLLFQPMIRACSRRLHGVEALVRWQHPKRGYLGPDSFLPALERTNTMGALTQWTIDNAVQMCARWAADGLTVPVSVNLSATVVDEAWIVDAALASLAVHGVAPSLLTLEVTETALTEHPQGAARTLQRLRAAGVHVSLDDFGTGYTSLSLLKSHVFDEIKIDRSFVTSMRHSPADAAIVRSVLELGHRLGSRVVAEGVEDDGTARMLEDLGCDVLQGYLFAKPLSPADAALHFRAQHASPEHTRHAGDPAAAASNAVAVAVNVTDRRDGAGNGDGVGGEECLSLRVVDAQPDPVLDEIVEVARHLCGTQSAMISIIDGERLWFAARTKSWDLETVSAQASEDDLEHLRAHALCAHAILRPSEVMQVSDASRDPRFTDNPYVTGPPHVRFYAGAPLTTSDGHTIGTLCVNDPVERSLNDAQLQSLRRLAQIAVKHMESARSEAVLRRLRDLTGHLAAMHSDVDLPDAASVVVSTARGILGANGAVLFIPEHEGAVRFRPLGISARTSSDSAGVSTAVLDSRAHDLVSRAIRARVPGLFNLCDDADREESLGPFGQVAASSVLCVPMFNAGKGQVNAVLVAWWWRSAPVELSTLDRTAVDILTDQAGATLGRLETLARLHVNAQLDPLTGLLNRTAFLERVRAEPNDGIVILLDLERLSSVNEQHGQCAGDRLLKAFAGHLRASARDGDLIARWSGRRFAIAPLSASTEDAQHLLERLSQSWTDNLIDFRATCTPTSRRESVATALHRAQSGFEQAAPHQRNLSHR